MNYLETNKITWDKRTKIHVDSKLYNVKGFLDGGCSLREIETSEMGSVKGKRLLHLQCHFGLDTLSWARKGAIVTGVDFSPVAIEQANQIKKSVNIDAQFICSDVYEFGEKESNGYDIVFTSYGVLCWLPSLSLWAKTIAKHLKPGGRFYMVEFHPVHDLFSGYSYFHSSEPDVEEASTYTENSGNKKSTMITWAHPLSEVINALITAGIRILRVNEFPFSPYNCFDGLEEKEQGRFYFVDSKHEIPMVYSILGDHITQE